LSVSQIIRNIMKTFGSPERTMFYGARSDIRRAAVILRKQMTLEEKILWKVLKDRDTFGVKFRRQHPVNDFVVDFYCHELKLVIELDGEVHNDIEIKDHDIGRQHILSDLGLTVLRFSNDQIYQELNLVKESIQLTISQLHNSRNNQISS
jgi:imidazole glycerol-phosphate synthase subunit HisF